MNINFSNIINIPQSLKDLKNYVVIKKSDYFPNYYDFDDVDIFCNNRKNFIEQLKLNLKEVVDPSFKILFHTQEHNTHIDVIPPNCGRLNLRFDVYDSFSYKKFFVNPHYFSYILHESKVETYDDVEILFPSEPNDLVLRFFEWVEMPEKQKHLSYVRNHFKKTQNFVKLIKQYTNIPTILLKELEG